MRTFTFQWPHHAEEVYVTGTFDNWTKSERLERVGQVFETTVTFPETSDKIYYKFVVDGRWITDHAAPQEKDHEGNENNVLLPEQMDKLEEEASQAAAINNLVPESTTAQLAGAVPLEGKKEDKKEEGEGLGSDAALLSSATPESTTAQLAAAVPLEEKKGEGEGAGSDAAILSSAAPESTTAQLAGAAPLEKTKDSASLPGSYPETPATELEKEFKVSPLPAAEGAINPIKLAPGEKVPRDLTAAAIDSHVTLDEESYEKSDRIPGIDTTLPRVTGNMIPESSLPITGANDVAINTVGLEATTTALAGDVPLEPKVPDIVKQSQEKAKVEPEASANSEEVREKAAVEEELLEKVREAPSTSEGTAGQGTEKSETDKTTVENVLAAATSAGEVALGAAITAGGAAAVAATKASSTAADVAAKAGDAVTDAASKATIAASTAAHDAATRLPANVKGVLPGAAHEAEAEAEKQKAAIDAVSSEVPVEVKESIKAAGVSPEATVNTAAVEEKKGYEAEILEKVKPAEAVGEPPAKTTEEEQKAAIDAISSEVPAEVKESLQQAGASPEAATNTAAVEDKKEVEAELLEKVKPAEAVAKSSPKAPEDVKPLEEARLGETFPKPMDESSPSEAPHGETKPKPAGEETALAVEPPQPVEEVKAVDVAKPTETKASNPAVEHPATTGHAAPVEAAKVDEVHPATNGTATVAAPASSSIRSQTDKSTSEKKKKHRISGFFSKLKHKFA